MSVCLELIDSSPRNPSARSIPLSTPHCTTISIVHATPFRPQTSTDSPPHTTQPQRSELRTEQNSTVPVRTSARRSIAFLKPLRLAGRRAHESAALLISAETLHATEPASPTTATGTSALGRPLPLHDGEFGGEVLRFVQAASE